MPHAEEPNQELEAEIGWISAELACRGGAGLGCLGAALISAVRLSSEGSPHTGHEESPWRAGAAQNGHKCRGVAGKKGRAGDSTKIIRGGLNSR